MREQRIWCDICKTRLTDSEVVTISVTNNNLNIHDMRYWEICENCYLKALPKIDETLETKLSTAAIKHRENSATH